MRLCAAIRAVLARIAARVVSLRAWERIGYARLSDYAAERLGLSARWVRDLAQVGLKLDAFPRLEEAQVSGTLGWTKVRLLARLPREEDEEAWIAHARSVTAEKLSREVRAVDRGSVEAGAAEEDGARSRLFEVRCRPEVRWKWHAARGAAVREAGHVLHVSEAAELIAAEVLSALPIDEREIGAAPKGTREPVVGGDRGIGAKRMEGRSPSPRPTRASAPPQTRPCALPGERRESSRRVRSLSFPARLFPPH